MRVLSLLLFSLSVGFNFIYGQATVREEQKTIKTYKFSDPNPIPILADNPKIYPYFKYEGYANEAIDTQWTVVTLENKYIEVSVLPQVGGKVWGAVEKSTGEEFIYRNEVMKFRNISMRGPWTSGGIEFNFGIIGHHPSTATAVDYRVTENDDGSVSCIVGNIDLPSRTQWRVEIRLPAEAAYFETRVLWYNPTALDQSYYNWMTAAAEARSDLTFYCPGDQYLDHPGNSHPWPTDSAGRNLEKYAENAFGPSKSYHVVGVYDDFFGGYYEEKDVGFGHWAPYEEMPGQKLWLWAQSRSGAIWEDLLTDTDGQYIEFQAGRLFNQYSPSSDVNPITQASFEPGATDLWREIWFPVKSIGGLTEVSSRGVLHIQDQGDSVVIGVNALVAGSGSILVFDDANTVIVSDQVDLKPMDVHQIKIPKDSGFRVVRFDALDLDYDKSAQISKKIDRPFKTELPVLKSLEQAYRSAQEQIKFRDFAQAAETLDTILMQQPSYLDALTSRADLYYRSGHFSEGYQMAKDALRQDTYHAPSNFIAAQCAKALGKEKLALEYLGWSARSLAYRAEAYAEISVLYLRQQQLQKALRYARNALDFNKFHLKARQVLSVIARLTKNGAAASRQQQFILTIDPLNHFPYLEMYLMTNDEKAKQAYLNSHRSELPDQTMLELAALYHEFGRDEDALVVLDLAPQNPLVDLWWCYLARDSMPDASKKYLDGIADLDHRFQFPYRLETLPMLQWAVKGSGHWKLKYLLALNYWALGRTEDAAELLNAIGKHVDDATLYLTRAALDHHRNRSAVDDLKSAVLSDKQNWRAWRALTAALKAETTLNEARNAAHEAFEAHPNNYSIGMDLAEILVEDQAYGRAIEVLSSLRVLPFEGAFKGRILWEQAHLGAALNQIEAGHMDQAKKLIDDGMQWPEHLGVGKPYDPDLRRFKYVQAYLNRRDKDLTKTLLQDVFRQTIARQGQSDLDQVLALLSIRRFNHAREMEAFVDLEDAPDPIGPWIMTMIKGDEQEIRRMEARNPQLFSGVNYTILKRIASLN